MKGEFINMNASKKHLFPSVALLSVAALLGSCGIQGTSSNPSNSSASSQPNDTSSETSSQVSTDPYAVPTNYVPFSGDPKQLTATVDFWETFGASGTTATTMGALVTAFQKIFPNITINLVNKGGYPDINSAIAQAIPSGTEPTMATCYPDHVAGYMSAPVIENMAGYLQDPLIGLGVDDGTGGGALSDIIPAYMAESVNYPTSGVFSMPFTKSTEAMFYNKTMFEAKGWNVPTTWDEMWNLCKTIKEDSTIEGIDAITPFGYDSDDNLFITYDAQTDTPYTSATGDHYLFNNAANKSFVTSLKDKYDKHYFLTKGSSANSTYTSTQFTGKTLFMTVGSTGGTTYNYTDNFDVGVAAIPQVDTNASKVISQGPSICFFKRASIEQRQAAWLFYKFITNANNTALWASLTGYNPIRTSAYSTEVWTDWKNGATAGKDKLLADVADYVQANSTGLFTSPAFKGSAVARTQVSGIVSSVLLGTKSVDTAFSDAIAACALVG